MKNAIAKFFRRNMTVRIGDDRGRVHISWPLKDDRPAKAAMYVTSAMRVSADRRFGEQEHPSKALTLLSIGQMKQVRDACDEAIADMEKLCAEQRAAACDNEE